MKKIRILMVLATTDIGGAEMYVLNLLRNMDLSKFHVDLAVSFNEKGDGISREVRDLGCEIYYLPYFKVYNYFHYVNTWDAFLTEHRYDIVHGHATNSASVYLRVAKKHGCVTISHCHSAGFRGNWMTKKVKKIMTAQVGKVADYWFACSEKAAEHLYGESYRYYNNYYTIPNAINTEKYLFSETTRKRIRNSLSISDDVLLCGHIGSLTPPKNHAFLLDIFKSVLAKKPNAYLLLCGDGFLRNELEKKALALGISERVIFQGVVRNVCEYMMAMDVLVFPSIFEGFPITVIEAEATGLPIVLSEVITKEVDLIDCIIRRSLLDSSEKWAEAICKLKANDRCSYNYLISNSVFNMNQAVLRMQSMYTELLDTKYKFYNLS